MKKSLKTIKSRLIQMLWIRIDSGKNIISAHNEDDMTRFHDIMKKLSVQELSHINKLLVRKNLKYTNH